MSRLAAAALLVCFSAQVPVPTRLLEAKTAVIVNGGTKQDHVDTFARELAKIKRFEIVSDHDKADVIFTLSNKSKGSVGVPIGGVLVSSEIEGFALAITDRPTKEPLWSDTQEVDWRPRGALSALVKRLDVRLGKPKG